VLDVGCWVLGVVLDVGPCLLKRNWVLNAENMQFRGAITEIIFIPLISGPLLVFHSVNHKNPLITQITVNFDLHKLE
jgi:hypothetical protein